MIKNKNNNNKHIRKVKFIRALFKKELKEQDPNMNHKLHYHLKNNFNLSLKTLIQPKQDGSFLQRKH